MKWWQFILAAGGICLLSFFVWALLLEKKEIELLPSTPSGPVDVASFSIALISGGEPSDVPWTSRSPAARRVRRVFPDLSWMTPEPTLKVGDEISLALFEDAVFNAIISDVTRYPNGAVGMTADLNGTDHGAIYLSYFSGELTVSVESGRRGEFAIRSRQGDHYALEVDRSNSDVLEGGDEMAPVESAVEDFSSLSSAESLSSVELEVVDVMIVYTPAATEWASTNGGIQSFISQAMQRANATHSNSNTEVSLNLVHSAEVNYVETSNVLMDLSRLRGTTDEYMDDVHTLRDQYGADLVCLFEVRNDVGGYGYPLSSEQGSPGYGFCLARIQQVGSTYTVVHEWGHNMGCDHSKTQVSYPGVGLYSYSSGWQWSDSASPYDGYCSVMTYEDFDHDGSREYRRVAHFSNPDVDYIGAETNATGDAVNGDNARTIRNIRSVIANYRTPSDDLDGDGLPNAWELLYFGGETNANPSAIASNGVNTVLQTYIAGLDPTDPESLFKVSFTNGFVVRWNATSGRVYSVLGSTHLPDGFQSLETNILWPQNSWTDEVDRSTIFYQVGVELEE